MQVWDDREFEDVFLLDQGVRSLQKAAAVDTYCIVWYDFEQNNWQGWLREDNTAQIKTWTRVDNFSGLGGGNYGGLVAREGSQSLWCGARPTEGPFLYMCSWDEAPGYGNGWNQYLVIDDFAFTGLITFSYSGYFDSEPGFDFTVVEYDAGGGNWQELASYDGANDTVAVHELQLAQARTKLRFHFTADGAWSDQDGLWDTDGAFVVDSILVSDVGGTVDYENCEAASFGDTEVDGDANTIYWRAEPEQEFGMYSGLWTNLDDKDPCGDNFATQVVFFFGSDEASSTYPGLYDTPFCKGGGNREAPCQNEIVYSPVIDMKKYSSASDENQDANIPAGDLPGLGGALLRFTTYRDIPLSNLVFYVWHVRNVDPVTGCPSQWQDRNFVYYGPDKDYIYGTFDVSDLVGEDPIQVAIGCIDNCDVWYGRYGNCAAHTPSPWIDNVRVYRYATVGPQWSWRDLDIFQDNFPEDAFEIESVVRADAANDLNPNTPGSPIRPGDSIVVDCTSNLGGGIDTTPDGRPMVYMHVRAMDIGGVKPNLYGPTLEGDYGTYDSDDGSMWTIFQGDVALAGGVNPVDDKYMFDLNDSLFTRGYMIEYYFMAYDRASNSSRLPSGSQADFTFFEFTCLPTLESDVLFVDDFHGRPVGTPGTVQRYWDPTFAAVLPPENVPDRYDVNGPSSLVSNGPGSRAKNEHLKTAYVKVIWDCGNLESGTITDGSADSDKSQDCQMLIDWMNLSDHVTGLWVLGDDVAQDLAGLTSAQAIAFLNTWCGVTLVNGSYYELTGGRIAGGVVTPKVFGVGGSVFASTDSFYVFGGCPIVNEFDVLDVTNNGQYALQYPDYLATQYYAGVQSVNTNSLDHAVRTMFFGFSWMYVRDCEPATPPVRNVIAEKVFAWMQNETNIDITEGDTPPAKYSLAQNYPNPFNPSTSIKFDLVKRGHVSLRIYNVAGQLVRTLVNDTRDAGNYTVAWDGKNDLGKSVASGVYFYKLESGTFTATKKMVMLR